MAIDRAKVVELYSSGLTTTRVAQELGCSRPSVSRILKEEGVFTRSRSLDLDEALIQELYRGGLSIRSIAKRLGCSYKAIFNRLDEKRTPWKDPDIDPDEVIRLYIKQRMSSRHAAQVLGCSDTFVRTVLGQEGVLRRCSSPFGTRQRFRHHGHPVKLGSGWERHVYSILWREFGEGFFFQGEFGEREHKCTPKLDLVRARGLAEKYAANKDTYTWHPDFLIPGFGILEVKGGWKARQRWNQCVVPCIRATEMEYEVYALNVSPYGTRSWEELEDLLEQV